MLFSAMLSRMLTARGRLQDLALEWEAAAQLAYDAVQLAVLLALTGGLQNPFVFLFVAPVAVSATVLRPAVTAMLAALTFACVGVISVMRLPLPWPEGAPPFDLPPLYQLGVATVMRPGWYECGEAVEPRRVGVSVGCDIHAARTRGLENAFY